VRPSWHTQGGLGQIGPMDDSEFDAAGRVPEEGLRLAEAFVFASPEPVTKRALAPLLPEGTNTYLIAGCEFQAPQKCRRLINV
jgi:hypothetical protein